MEKKYDVFMSCKSEDYEYAEEVYNFLNSNGVRTFLASKELRKMGDSEYRNAIMQALESAYHLIIFASKPEYVESKWVFYEWDTFVNAKLNGRKDGQIMTILKGVETNALRLDLIKYESFTYGNYKERILPYVETPESQRVKKLQKQQEDTFRQQAAIKAQRRIEEERQARIREEEYKKALVETTRREREVQRRLINNQNRQDTSHSHYTNNKQKGNHTNNTWYSFLPQGNVLYVSFGVIITLFIVLFYVLKCNDEMATLEENPIEINNVKEEVKPVNLGLPSGTLWADRNVGALSPEDDGSHYAFGTIESLIDYPESTGEEFMDGESIIGTKYDIAKLRLGEEWQMPSRVQMEELIKCCKYSLDGNGYRFVGPNGNSIFLPFTEPATENCVLSIGYYWSGNKGYILEFQSEPSQDYEPFVEFPFASYCGNSIRAVKSNE